MKVAVCSRSFSRHPQLRAELQAEFPEAYFNDDGASLDGDSLVAFLEPAERAVTALERVDADVVSRLPNLKVISKYGVGTDTLDFEALDAAGIQVGWTAGVNRRSVAELVIAMAISCLRLLPQATTEVRSGTWRQIVGNQLSDQTVGIVGCGNIGKDLVKLLKPFGCKILVNDIVDYADFYREHGVEPVDLEDLLRRAGVVTLHVPRDASTLNMLSRERMAMMKPGSILINAARGGILDEDALKSSLESGHLSGAALDVLAVEPPADTALLQLPNLIVTPHIGGSAAEAILAMGRAAIEGLSEYRAARSYIASS